MKLSVQDIKSLTVTKIEPSLTVAGVWLGRSGVGLQVNNENRLIFGFSSSFSSSQAETSAFHELLENIAFCPNVYTDKKAHENVMNVNEDFGCILGQKKISDFLQGALGPNGTYYSNGCAIAPNREHAFTHSRYELLERHICCEVWYKRAHVLHELECSLQILDSDVKISAYTIKDFDQTIYNGSFAIAALDYPKLNFFVLGAGVKADLHLAAAHAIGETIMIFEDAVRGREGRSCSQKMKDDILSLRKKKESDKRRHYFNSLLSASLPSSSPFIPSLQTIVFEPFAGYYAARTFSNNILDPLDFEVTPYLPIMPLF